MHPAIGRFTAGCASGAVASAVIGTSISHTNNFKLRQLNFRNFMPFCINLSPTLFRISLYFGINYCMYGSLYSYASSNDLKEKPSIRVCFGFGLVSGFTAQTVLYSAETLFHKMHFSDTNTFKQLIKRKAH